MLLRTILIFLLFCVLTLVSQVGGIVLLIFLLAWIPVRRKITSRTVRAAAVPTLFAAMYFLSVFFIVPIAARSFGRVPLPVFEEDNIRPLNVWTCLLNRHYVRPELRDVVVDVAKRMSEKYPGTVVRYLDAKGTGSMEFLSR